MTSQTALILNLIYKSQLMSRLYNKENESTNNNFKQYYNQNHLTHKLGCPLSTRKNQSNLYAPKHREFTMYSPQPISVKDYSLRQIYSPKSSLSSKKIEVSSINKLIKDIRQNQQQINHILRQQQTFWNSITQITDLGKFQHAKSKLKKIKRLGGIINKVILRSTKDDDNFHIQQCSIEKNSYQLQIAHQVIMDLQEVLKLKQTQILTLNKQISQLKLLLTQKCQNIQQTILYQKINVDNQEVQTYPLLSPMNYFSAIRLSKSFEICVPPFETHKTKENVRKTLKSIIKLTVYCLNSLAQFAFKQLKTEQLSVFERKIKFFSQQFNQKYRSIPNQQYESFMKDCKQRLQKIYNQLLNHIL